MVTAIRTALTAAHARRADRYMATVRFCDGCAEVSDGADRSTSHRRQVQEQVFSSFLTR